MPNNNPIKYITLDNLSLFKTKEDEVITNATEAAIATAAQYTDTTVEDAVEEAAVYTNSVPTTVTVGGIAKGTTFDNKPILDILEDMLYPYVAFNFSGFTTTPEAKTYEYGDAKSVSSVTPAFVVGSKAINSIKVGASAGGTDYYTGDSATSGTAITLTTAAALDGLHDTNLYMTLSDGENTITKSVEFKFAKYYYYAVSSSTTPPSSSSSATAIGTSSVVNSITTHVGDYIWFLAPAAKTKIQQFAMNQWNDVETTSAGAVTFTTRTGQELTYYAYRTPLMVEATGKYQLV